MAISLTSVLCRPSKVGLHEYLTSLKRIDQALSQLTTTNLRVNQQSIGDYNELISEGSSQLQNVFRSLLSEDLQPVEPLHYITKREVSLHISGFSSLSGQNYHSQQYLRRRSRSLALLMHSYPLRQCATISIIKGSPLLSASTPKPEGNI